jgi:hypothetical protein
MGVNAQKLTILLLIRRLSNVLFGVLLGNEAHDSVPTNHIVYRKIIWIKIDLNFPAGGGGF